MPGLAGFFSKDEILFETFAEGHTMLWVIGALTSLLTATYMFRLVFLTFHGERRHDAPAAARPTAPRTGTAACHGCTAHGHAWHAHGRGGHLHDAPPAMALALIVLAIGSVAGRLHRRSARARRPQRAGTPGWSRRSPRPLAAAGAEAAGEAAAAPRRAERAGEEALELTLMGVSSGIAFVGIGIAAFIWLKRREHGRRRWRARFAPIHRLLLNKYYVDEIYDATVVQPDQGRVAAKGCGAASTSASSTAPSTASATLVDGGAAVLRRLQTGSVRTYAGSLFVGVVLVLGYYLWR